VAQGNGARGLPSQPPATAPSLPAASDPLATRHPAVNTRNAQSPQDNLEAGHGPSPTAPSHVSKRFWCSRMGKGMILATIAAAAFFAGYVTRDELVKAENAKILTRLDALQAQCDSTVTKVETLKESTDSHINSINTKMMTLDQRGSVFEKKLNQTDNTLELVKTDITNIQGDFKVRSDSMTATFSVAGFSNAVLADVETSGESIKVVGNLCLILQKGFYSIRHSHLKDDKTQTGLCIRVGSESGAPAEDHACAYSSTASHFSVSNAKDLWLEEGAHVTLHNIKPGTVGAEAPMWHVFQIRRII